MELYLLGGAGALVVVLGILSLAFGLQRIFSDELSPRLRTFVTEQDTDTHRWKTLLVVQTRDLSGSLLNRLVLPVFQRFGNFLGRLTPSNALEDLRHKLYIAGNPLGLGPREFYGIRLAFLILGAGLVFVILRRTVTWQYLLFAMLILILCYLFPIVWLRALVSSRQNQYRKGMPDALDMLSVCVDAGLGFDQAMQRVGEQWKTPIAMEFGRVVTEMEMGLSRREALRNLADRLDISELSSFVAVILQSDKLGMSIADTLHAQADQMRVERRYRAQERARTTPIKMLIPLAFLIFPAIMAILIGPALPSLLDLFRNF
jgi:tight adherence protein C